MPVDQIERRLRAHSNHTSASASRPRQRLGLEGRGVAELGQQGPGCAGRAGLRHGLVSGIHHRRWSTRSLDQGLGIGDILQPLADPESPVLALGHQKPPTIIERRTPPRCAQRSLSQLGRRPLQPRSPVRSGRPQIGGRPRGSPSSWRDTRGSKTCSGMSHAGEQHRARGNIANRSPSPPIPSLFHGVDARQSLRRVERGIESTTRVHQSTDWIAGDDTEETTKRRRAGTRPALLRWCLVWFPSDLDPHKSGNGAMWVRGSSGRSINARTRSMWPATMPGRRFQGNPAAPLKISAAQTQPGGLSSSCEPVVIGAQVLSLVVLPSSSSSAISPRG